MRFCYSTILSSCHHLWLYLTILFFIMCIMYFFKFSMLFIITRSIRLNALIYINQATQS